MAKTVADVVVETLQAAGVKQLLGDRRGYPEFCDGRDPP